MSQLMIKIVNATTGEEIEREMNDKELAQYELDKAANDAAHAAKAEQQALRDSANAKLLDLGLSPEEVAAITGA